MVLNKHEIEAALHAEHREITAGRLKEDNPLDFSQDFRLLCVACRRGDLKVCQEKISEGVNINAKDKFDYTPLILASLCGHFEVVQLLLESGALCERDTFQGERCLYNALNDKIRNLLLSYDYSKSRDPLQPLAGHITSLLSIRIPQTSDITLSIRDEEFKLHKFILSARSPYFAKKLSTAPHTSSWRVPISIPARSLDFAIKALYFQELQTDFGTGEEADSILVGIEKLGRQLEIGRLFETLLEADPRIARQHRTEEIERGRYQFEDWFQRSVLANQIEIPKDKVDDVKWDLQNSVFADVLLCANEEPVADVQELGAHQLEFEAAAQHRNLSSNGIPIGSFSRSSRSPSRTRISSSAKSIIIPAHRAMLLRSEYFNTMFSSSFAEAQSNEHLPLVRVDCSSAVLRIILTYLYTERADFGLDVAVDVLFAADLLFIEKLKVRAAQIISTLGNGGASVGESDNPRGETDLEAMIDIYDVIRAGWDTRMHRLEEFGARYIANRLERYVDQEEFHELVKESAARIQKREETDTVELIDDIRFYLSERFRFRFEDVSLDKMMNENTVSQSEAQDQIQTCEQDISQLPQMKSNGSVEDALRQQSHLEERINMFTPSIGEGKALLQDTPGVVRTLNGEIAADEVAQDALNYQFLMGKIDELLESLKLDA